MDDAPRDCGELLFHEGRGGRLRVEPRGPDGERLDAWPERIAATDELLEACGATGREEPGHLPLPGAAWDGERLTLRVENGQAVYAAIGCTRNLRSRVRALAHASPEPLRLVAWIRGGAEDTEKHLHAHYAEFRSHGEWFRLSLALVKLVDHLKSANAYMAKRTKPLLLPAEA